jgi:hypothetical protein
LLSDGEELVVVQFSQIDVFHTSIVTHLLKNVYCLRSK